MNLYFDILKNDLRLIFRDKSLMVTFIVPVSIIALCRFGLPPLTQYYPEIEQYYWLIIASLVSVSAAMPSYLLGFILLDERDENVDILLRILPLPNYFVLKIRTVFVVFLSYLFSFFILLFNGLIHINFIILVSLSFLFALTPLVLTFAIAAFAKNKIEAATMYKGLNTILILPIVAFLVPGALKYFFGIIPFFWTYNAITVNSEPLLYGTSFIVSVIMHLLFAGFFYRIYIKKLG